MKKYFMCVLWTSSVCVSLRWIPLQADLVFVSMQNQLSNIVQQRLGSGLQAACWGNTHCSVVPQSTLLFSPSKLKQPRLVLIPLNAVAHNIVIK